MVKRYIDWLGLLAVSSCLALMLNSAAAAHQPPRAHITAWVLNAELWPETTPDHTARRSVQ